jgi:two-component system cell cycle response regulator
MKSMNLSIGGVSPRSILVVDDDPLVRRALAAQLAPLGCRLEFAADGVAALAQIAEQPPDLVLLDISMPGLDGFEVCRRIKGNLETAGIPVIHLTSLGDEAKERSFAAGADDFLVKPAHLLELRSRIRSHLLIRSLQEEVKASQELERVWSWEKPRTAKVLVVVSDPDLREFVVDEMRNEGHDAAWADSIKGCLARFGAGLPDLLIISHQLHDGSGEAFVGHLRNFVKSRDLPVLILCSREALGKKGSGPESGPVDYLTVPTHAGALKVRGDILLRQGRLLAGRSLERIGPGHDLILDPPTGAYSEAFLEAHLTLLQGSFNLASQALGLLGVGCYQEVGGWQESRDLIHRTAAQLSAALRPGEALCRVADRTFVVLMPGTDLAGIDQRIQSLIQAGLVATVAGLQATPRLPASTLLRRMALTLQKKAKHGSPAPALR